MWKTVSHMRSRVGLMVIMSASGGCQVAQPQMAGYPAYDYAAVRPSAGPAAMPMQAVAVESGYMPSSYQAMEATALQLKERLDRVEKAMLRLDRRMQLVERNELGRMGGATSAASVGPQSSLKGSEGASDEQVAMQALDIQDGYRPVASRNETITSALQAAPRLADVQAGASSSGEVQLASRGGLPSLADPSQPESRSLQAGQQKVAIWTVNYQDDKVWPDRSQLPSSRDVVEVLRQNGKANVYARGKNASAVAFRERVKALSRYLSKVSSLDSVPIAAMAAPHLDDETVEIVVTH